MSRASIGFGSSASASWYEHALDTGSRFPVPWLSMASSSMPTGPTVLDWCELIFETNGTYREAIRRLVSYFLTDFDVRSVKKGEDIGEDERHRWLEYLRDDAGILEQEQQMGMDIGAYGNFFLSVNRRFHRFLRCPRCHRMLRFREMAEHRGTFRLSFSRGKFLAYCPRCRHNGEWRIEDKPIKDSSGIEYRRWSPREIIIEPAIWSDRCKYYWNIPSDYRQKVMSGIQQPFVLENCPQSVLECIAKNQPLYEFDEDAIFHAKEHTLSGILTNGWGVSRMVANLRHIWYVVMLYGHNEVLAADYVIPVRLISPAVGARHGQGDPSGLAGTIDGREFMRFAQRMIKRRRFQPQEWYVSPYPMHYQILGGDAKQLVPTELLEQGEGAMLNATGLPAELYRGTLRADVVPVMLRLFEATNIAIPRMNNAFLRYVIKRVSMLLGWDTAKGEHKRVTHADNIQMQMARMQLMLAGKIAETDVLEEIGIDRTSTKRKQMEEMRLDQKLQASLQEEMDQIATGEQLSRGGNPYDQFAMQQQQMAAAGGQMVPPGAAMPPPAAAPAAGGGAPAAQAAPQPGVSGLLPPGMGPVDAFLQSGVVPNSPPDILATADQLAQQLVLDTSGVSTQSQLKLLQQHGMELLYTATKERVSVLKRQMRDEGQRLVQQQMVGAA